MVPKGSAKAPLGFKKYQDETKRFLARNAKIKQNPRNNQDDSNHAIKTKGKPPTIPQAQRKIQFSAWCLATLVNASHILMHCSTVGDS